MNNEQVKQKIDFHQQDIIARFKKVREVSEWQCEPLIIEDYGLQAMPETSPAKWHLAHTSWFFETFLLKPYLKNYQSLNNQYEFLFNSYYNGVGKQYPRPQRGLLSRPSVEEIYHYREYVNKYMYELLSSEVLCNEELINKVILGCHHEQQHQELFFTDLKYSWFHNPLYPVYKSRNTLVDNSTPKETEKWYELTEGLYDIGFQIHENDTTLNQFCFDNELPRHKYYMHDVSLSHNLVTNAQYLSFIEDDAYHRSNLWLSDAWALIKDSKKQHAPLYWVKQDQQWFEYTLQGLQPLNLNQPVSHISAYEADAFARWVGCRLPTEFEWEVFAIQQSQTDGQFLESEQFHPTQEDDNAKVEMGKLWQWTSSAYSPYPGFKTAEGAIGEYNGKFMCNQLVLRGGSCVTSENHYRDSYRNFFYPQDQWQFSGLRLAK